MNFHFSSVWPVALYTGLLACSSMANAQLNDTGVIRNGGFGADHQYGRDAAAAAGVLPKVGSGAKGFDFSKICNNGEVAGTGSCPADPELGSGANDWACTRDNVTSLIWEVKTRGIEPGNRGLRDTLWFYTWYDSNPATNGGDAGAQDGVDSCFEAATRTCDTEGYVGDVNAAALCGFTDWRMPTRAELWSIIDYGVAPPDPIAIDTDFFPNTGAFYWSASGYAGNSNSAWVVLFIGGNTINDKTNAWSVRLVRSGQ